MNWAPPGAVPEMTSCTLRPLTLSGVAVVRLHRAAPLPLPTWAIALGVAAAVLAALSLAPESDVGHTFELETIEHIWEPADPLRRSPRVGPPNR